MYNYFYVKYKCSRSCVSAVCINEYTVGCNSDSYLFFPKGEKKLRKSSRGPNFLANVFLTKDDIAET
jgi:hypothetical protein